MAKEKKIIILEDFDFQTPKTKQYIDLKNNLKINDKKSVLVLSNENKNIYLSARNLKQSMVLTTSQLTTYDVLNSGTLVLTVSSVDRINEVFGVNQEK